MFNAQVIGPGAEALMESLQSNIQTAIRSVNLKETRGYVFSLSGTMDLGRVQPANIALVAGGNVEELKVIYKELGHVIEQAEEAVSVEAARLKVMAEMKAKKYAEPSFDDYATEAPEERPMGPLEALMERLGFRIRENGESGPVLRCNDYPNCACGRPGPMYSA